MKPEHDVKLRVRYEETDTMQVVYYAKFFVWFEVGRIDLLRYLGVAYKDLERRGMWMPVIEAKATYKAPARFDDEILVKTRITKVGNSSVTFENTVLKLPEMKLLCSGYTVHVLVDSGGKPTKIPVDIARRLRPS